MRRAPSQFLWGAQAMAAWVAGLFFLQFWRSTHDRLFLFLCLAFWVLSLSWIGLGLHQASAETHYSHFVIRLVAFILIIVGIIDKSRKRLTS
jgi:uncharacterized membrane protein